MNKIKITKYKKIAILVLMSLLISACGGGNFAASPTPIPLPAVGGGAASMDSTSGDTSSENTDSENTDSENTEDTPAESSPQEAEQTETATNSDDASSSATSDAATDEPAETESNVAATESTDITPAQGIAPEDAAAPTQIDIERIGFSAPITPMDWRIVRVGEQRTTEWIIPDDSAGWHPDSAGAGAAGNLVLSGFQNQGDAVFSQLALGNVQKGQELRLTAADGSTHTYIVTEVGTPIPLDGASAAERERAATYYEPSEDARLTMVTGWPAFTTTHRLFIVATLVES